MPCTQPADADSPATLAEQGQAADRDHLVISVGGWTCDECGLPVNGQTNDEGQPLLDGDSVRHTP